MISSLASIARRLHRHQLCLCNGGHGTDWLYFGDGPMQWLLTCVFASPIIDWSFSGDEHICNDYWKWCSPSLTTSAVTITATLRLPHQWQYCPCGLQLQPHVLYNHPHCHAMLVASCCRFLSITDSLWNTAVAFPLIEFEGVDTARAPSHPRHAHTPRCWTLFFSVVLFVRMTLHCVAGICIPTTDQDLVQVRVSWNTTQIPNNDTHTHTHTHAVLLKLVNHPRIKKKTKKNKQYVPLYVVGHTCHKATMFKQRCPATRLMFVMYAVTYTASSCHHKSCISRWIQNCRPLFLALPNIIGVTNPVFQQYDIRDPGFPNIGCHYCVCCCWWCSPSCTGCII